MDYCGKNQADLLRDAIFRIIDYYNPEENIVFADSTCSQLMNTLSPPVNMQSATETTHWSLIRRIVVLTDKALYLLSYSKDCHYNVRDSKTNEIIKALPIVLLERRVSLKSSEGIQSAHLSKLADNCIVFKIQANTPIPDAEAVAKKKWEENNAVTHCPVTNTPFSMFQRRHHCRVSGKIYHDTACNFRWVVDLFASCPYHFFCYLLYSYVGNHCQMMVYMKFNVLETLILGWSLCSNWKILFWFVIRKVK